MNWLASIDPFLDVTTRHANPEVLTHGRSCANNELMHKTLSRLSAAVLFLTAVSGCRAEQEVDSNASANESIPKPSLPIAEPPLDRAKLLMSVAEAASAEAAGTDDQQAQRDLDGKQFEVRIRFGCEGQGPSPDDQGWSVDPDGSTLRVRVVPNLTLDNELVKAAAGEEVEAAEGIWLKRPWLLDATCPATQPATEVPTDEEEGKEAASSAKAKKQTTPEAPAPAVQRVGIVQFFAASDSRTTRRMDRPFEAVRKLKEGEQVGQQGFNIVLAGRLRAAQSGRVIYCAGSGRDRPPDCIVSGRIDRVFIERPEDRSVIAEWSD